MAIGMLQVLFLANLSNFYGSAFHANVNVHHFKVKRVFLLHLLRRANVNSGPFR